MNPSLLRDAALLVGLLCLPTGFVAVVAAPGSLVGPSTWIAGIALVILGSDS